MRFQVYDLGLIEFRPAGEFQRQLVQKIKEGRAGHSLILCRHRPVITFGRSANRANILATSEELNAKGIELAETERGGDVTYHGPGQLTVYPVFDLNNIKKDIHLFLRNLEGRITSVLEILGIPAVRREGLTGAWVGKKKIASIGIAVKNWITYHGFALNVWEDDLRNFSLIRPCGMDIIMTSIESESKRLIPMTRIKDILIKEMYRWPR
jgi:lipoate-protein ligase B